MGNKAFLLAIFTLLLACLVFSPFLDLCFYSVRFATTSVNKQIVGLDCWWLWDVSSWAECGQGAAGCRVTSRLKLWPMSLLPCVLTQTRSPTSKALEKLVTLTCVPAKPEFQGGNQALLPSQLGSCP